MPKDIDFEAGDKQLKEVIFSNLFLQIPRFQRPYGWNEDQITELWNDLVNNSDPIFLGSLILNHEKYPTTGIVEIVDGQQRLLTLTILLAVLRDTLKSIDLERAKLYQRQNIVVEDIDGNERVRIKCGDSAKDFFEKHIQSFENHISTSKPKTPEERIIKANYDYFYTKVTDEIRRFDTNAEKKKYIDDLRKKILDLIVIYIKIGSEEDAYEIFETTNARGLDLNVGDLLKNLVFKNIKANEVKDKAKEIWSDIESLILETNYELKKFLRYYWISENSFITEKHLYKAIKRKITDWDDFLNDLWKSSQLFNLLLNGNDVLWKNQPYKHPTDLYNSSVAIKNMGVSQCYVLFLNLLKNYSNLNYDLKHIFRVIENFSFVYSAVCKLPANRIERIYSRYSLQVNEALELEQEKKRHSQIQQILGNLEQELRELKPPFDYFKKQFLEIQYKNSDQGRHLVKYVLVKLNSEIEEKKEFVLNLEEINIEHILPIKPDKWGLSEKEIKPYVNLLGNLTLVHKQYNSKAGNKPIKEKISELEKSKIPITIKVIDQIKTDNYKWNEDSIITRQESFAKIAYESIWDY